MHGRKSKSIRVMTLCATLTVLGCAGGNMEAPPAPRPTAPAAAPQALPSGIVDAGAVTTTARVKSVDQQTRYVVLERADGSEVAFYADAQVRNLAQVKAGDEVRATFYESLAYEVKKPGTATPGATVTEGIARAKPGEKPAGIEAQAITMVATIVAIDKTAGTVTLRGPNGKTTAVKARDPRNLERVTVGDLVEITYTEAIAIAVEKSGKQ